MGPPNSPPSSMRGRAASCFPPPSEVTQLFHSPTFHPSSGLLDLTLFPSNISFSDKSACLWDSVCGALLLPPRNGVVQRWSSTCGIPVRSSSGQRCGVGVGAGMLLLTSAETWRPATLVLRGPTSSWGPGSRLEQPLGRDR